MRFIGRATTGLVLALVTLGLLAAAGWRIQVATQSADKGSRHGGRERARVVEVLDLAPQSFAPVITAYGQIRAWKSLEIRAPAGGPVTEISRNFRDGLAVAKGELLLRIDPDTAKRRVVDAKAALAQAELELSEARQSRGHAQSEISSAKAQLALRQKDLERKRSMFEKKLGTASALDEARLALTAAEQAVKTSELQLVALESRIDKAEAGVERARLAEADAEQALTETSYAAPFAGRLSSVSLTLGRRVTANEKLAELIDMSELEVAFQVRESDFGRLVDPATPNGIAALRVTVRLDLGGETVEAHGLLDRPAAVVTSQAGRTVYARLDNVAASVLRPGDFVTVTIEEKPLDHVAVVPSEAATVDGRILTVGEDGRLVEHQARVLRRQADVLVLADVPFGEPVVKRRLPYLAAGVKVTAREAGSAEAAGETTTAPEVAHSEGARAAGLARGEGRSGRGRGGADGATPGRGDGGGEDVVIDETRRAALIAFVQKDAGIPDDKRLRLLEELAKPSPSRRMLERLERRMAEGADRS
ncbi:MAG: HlyD family efflux transporter periplasmic adaptor subunit [Hyphomicrobiaceae bacterium]